MIHKTYTVRDTYEGPMVFTKYKYLVYNWLNSLVKYLNEDINYT